MLSDKTAIVTGGARGAGRTVAEALVARGASVVIADSGTSRAGDGRDPTVARQSVEALGKKAVAFTESIGSPGVARQLAELAVRTFGGLDILVNAAIIRRDGALMELEPGDFDAVIHNNLCAPFYLTRAVASEMLKLGRGGRIVNMIEPANAAEQIAYAAAQPAIVGLSTSASLSLAGKGVQVAFAFSAEDAVRLCTS